MRPKIPTFVRGTSDPFAGDPAKMAGPFAFAAAVNAGPVGTGQVGPAAFAEPQESQTVLLTGVCCHLVEDV